MQNERESAVLITQEVCDYLRISRPTCLKYFYTGRIVATRAGKGWRVLNQNWIGLYEERMREKPPEETLVKEG